MQHRQVGREVDADAVLGEYLAGALQGAADDLLDVGQFSLDVETAQLEPRRIQQVRDKAVEPLRFLLDRCYQLIARRWAVIVAVRRPARE